MSRKKKNKIKNNAVEPSVVNDVAKDGYDVVELNLNEVVVENTGDSITDYEKTVREIENYKTPSKFKRLLKGLIPWRGDPFREVLRKLVFIVALAVFISSAVYIINYQVNKIKNDRMMSEFSSTVDQVGKDIDDKVNAIIDSELEKRMQEKLREMLGMGLPAPSEDEIEQLVKDEIRDEVEALTFEEIKAKYPNVKFPEGISVKYAELYAKNQEMVGWININNTEVNFPVVQTTDNDKYLEYNFYKYKSTYGCPFVDYRNNVKNGIENFDTNTTIYGHHIRNGAMFAKLDVYKKLSGYKKSPVIEFNTITGDYKWKVVSVFITNVHSRDDNGSMFNYTSKLSTDAEFENFVEQIKLRSMYDIDVDIQKGDKFITLSTCSYDFDGARLVIVGRLVREGEDASVDTSKTKANPNPKYPQAWYDAYGKVNPYATTTPTKKPTTTTKTTTTTTSQTTKPTSVTQSTSASTGKETTTKAPTTNKPTTQTTTKPATTEATTTTATTTQAQTTTTEPTTPVTVVSEEQSSE